MNKTQRKRIESARKHVAAALAQIKTALKAAESTYNNLPENIRVAEGGVGDDTLALIMELACHETGLVVALSRFQEPGDES